MAAIGLGLMAVLPLPASAAGLASELGPGVSVERQPETGKVGFIGTQPGRAIDTGMPAPASYSAIARDFVDSHSSSFGLDQDGAVLRVRQTGAAAGDGRSIRLQQVQDGLPVLGAELAVTVDGAGDVLSVLGETSPAPDVSTHGLIGKGTAVETATALIARVYGVEATALSTSDPKLQIYDPRLLSAPGVFQEARTAWVLEVSSGLDTSSPIREMVIVDAATGTVSLHFSQIDEVLDRSVCDAGNTPTRVPCEAPFARVEGGPDTGSQDVDHAYRYSGDTYDFFKSHFGRDSLDGAGLPLKSTVAYCDPDPARPCPFPNAFWNGEQMVYGQGFAAADDVVAHELTHGLTEFTSRLFYYMQSGAINESMSDIFGEYIDQTNGSGTDTDAVRWKLGEDVPGIGAIRDMKTPGNFNDPDRMTSPAYVSDPSGADKGGVHSDSGVGNKAGYLLADGSSGEPGGSFNGQTIGALGINKAARIYYEVETSMLTPGSDYADLGNALEQACINLIGTDGINAGDCQNVSKVVLATEMETDPPASPTRNAPVCPSGQSPSAVPFADDLEDPSSGNWTTDGITGADAWHYPQPYDYTYATSGDTNFWGDAIDSTGNSAIRMRNAVKVPAGAFLRFNQAFQFESDADSNYDGGVVEYSTAGAAGPWIDAGPLFDSGTGYNGMIEDEYDNPLGGRQGFIGRSNGYGSSRLDLSSLAGRNVLFRFRIGSDEAVGDLGWLIDDVAIYNCAKTVVPDPPVDPDPPADPNPPVNPDPQIDPAKLGKLKVAGPKRARTGRRVVFRVRIANVGDATATGVRIRVRGRGIAAGMRIGRVGAGRTRLVRIKLRPRTVGTALIAFRVTSSNAGSQTVRKKITFSSASS